MGEVRAVGADQHTDGRQILGRMHPASRGLRWEPESSWGRAFPRRRVRRQTLWAEKRPLMPVSGGAKFPGASGTLSAPGRPSSHRFGRRMRGKPPKTAVDGKWGRAAPWGPTNIPTDGRAFPPKASNGLWAGRFGAEASFSAPGESGSSLGAHGVERRKISWGRAFPDDRRRVRRMRGQTLWAEKRPLMPVSGGAKFLAASGTLSAPGRPSGFGRPSSHRFGDEGETFPKTAVDGKWGRAAPWGPTNIPTDAKFWSADEGETSENSGRWKMGEGRTVGRPTNIADRRQAFPGRKHPASRGLRWETASCSLRDTVGPDKASFTDSVGG